MTHRDEGAAARARVGGAVPLHLVAVGFIRPGAPAGAPRFSFGLNRCAPSPAQAAAVAGVHHYLAGWDRDHAPKGPWQA